MQEDYKLIRSVLFIITNYWLQVFPSPKKILKHIEAICRSFLWSGSETNMKKASISWEKISELKNSGGMKLISLDIWRTVMCGKLLWNLSEKKDKLWVRWVNLYFIKNSDVLKYEPGIACSWMIKSAFKNKDRTVNTGNWTICKMK